MGCSGSAPCLHHVAPLADGRAAEIDPRFRAVARSCRRSAAYGDVVVEIVNVVVVLVPVVEPVPVVDGL